MRLSITEYQSTEIHHTPLVSYNEEDLRSSIRSANKQIKAVLGWKGSSNEPLSFSNGVLRASGFAGMIKLNREIELEVKPAHFPVLENSWRESLFFLSVLCRYGGALVSSSLSGQQLQKSSLYDLCGLILVKEFQTVRRSFIRTYQHHQFCDYSIEGDIVFDSFFDNSDGIFQEIVIFNKSNRINATIQKAMRMVLPFVSVPVIKNQLERAISIFGCQPSLVVLRKENIPSRNREWERLYSLSYTIVSGGSLSFSEGNLQSFGFVVDTWRVWEWLLSFGLTYGLANNHFHIRIQEESRFGTRTDENGIAKDVNVAPDISIYKGGIVPVLLVDAKYKALSQTNGITAPDIYEALAFCHAKSQNKIVLAYPDNGLNTMLSGQIHKYYEYVFPGVTVYGIGVGIDSICSTSDLLGFSRRIANQIFPYLS